VCLALVCRALKALESMERHAPEGAVAWAEEAMCELAVEAECQDEYEAMGEAMQVSTHRTCD